MCYEFSGWFGRNRAKELAKAREKLERRSEPVSPPGREEPAPRVPAVRETEEKIPA